MSRERLLTIRLLFGVVFIFGLVVAWCAQLGQVVQLSAASSLRRAVDKQDLNPEKQRLVETAITLEDNVWLWKATLYTAIGVVAGAAGCLAILPRARPGQLAGGG